MSDSFIYLLLMFTEKLLTDRIKHRQLIVIITSIYITILYRYLITSSSSCDANHVGHMTYLMRVILRMRSCAKLNLQRHHLPGCLSRRTSSCRTQRRASRRTLGRGSQQHGSVRAISKPVLARIFAVCNDLDENQTRNYDWTIISDLDSNSDLTKLLKYRSSHFDSSKSLVIGGWC